ncbi:hypothetical protein C8R45DRAFT_1105078 [Mycena sanguinolenta]|nr:hypothetical protein C8R45DRAFT_1105078 [Mycena sanguinolenta]
MTSTTSHNPLHHPNFYFSDGKAIFRLYSTGTLYNLHPGFLAERAHFFRSLFSLPCAPDCTQELLSEGKVDENPIELPHSISEMDFDSFLTEGISQYDQCSSKDDRILQEFLVSVMRMSAFFEMRDGMEHAKGEIERRGNCIHPAVKFELARCFRIDAWIEPTFRHLLGISVGDLSFSQVAQIGQSGYFWLTVTKAKIAELRAKIAFDVPPIVHSIDCNTRWDCAYAWSREWTDNVRNLIHHPDQPISCLGLLHQLRNVHISELCDKCQDLTVTWIWGKQLLTQEEDLIEKAIAALHELQVNEPLRVVINDTRVVLSSDL